MIVVGIDGSTGSRAALAFAVAEADLRQVPVRGVIAWHIPAGVYAGTMVPGLDFDLYRDSVITDARRELAETVGKDLADRVQLVCREGNPVAVLRDESKDAEMLVLGSRGRGGFTGLLLGSVSQQCAAHAECPVVIVHGEPE